ncbi:MAG: peptidase [Hyperionvirus sp.]|uniref:Peptidase n=1 Tax=Hyperionvirus sp. TaxID=2487770 RepID=A0A3G5A8E0_9VIRU|nr:MAG: peptidase [Hyperionvirus sp.]
MEQNKPENWDDLCFNKKRINDEFDILIQRSKSARELMLKINVNCDDNVRRIIGLLADDTYEFNSFHSLCKLLKMVSPSGVCGVWGRNDRLLKEHVEMFNGDRELFNKLSRVGNYMAMGGSKEWDAGDKLFVEKVLKGFGKYGSGELKAIQHEMNLVEEKVLGSGGVGIHALVGLRGKFVKLLGFETFMEFRSEVDMSYIKNTLHKIMAGGDIDQRCFDELKVMCRELGKERVGGDDIVRFRERVNGKYGMNLVGAWNGVVRIISAIWKLEFVRQESVKGWGAGVSVYEIKYGKGRETYGYLYVDLVRDKKGGKLDQTLSINLQECVEYPSGSGLLKMPVMVLLGSLDRDRVTYLEVIGLFREMGGIVHTLFHRAKYENINVRLEMRSFMGYLMEHLAGDLESIKQFFPKRAVEIHAGIMCDRAFKLKQQCIATLFDCVVHGSGKVFENGGALLGEYERIYKAIMNVSVNQCVMVGDKLPSNIVLGLIFNGGIVYSEITNSILAYNLYILLKEMKGFDQFANKVLRESLMPFDLAIKDFMVNRVEDGGYISENTNYFTEN